MRRPIIAGNWKMHKGPDETIAFLDELLPRVSNIEDREVVIAPPFVSLITAARRLRGSRVKLSAQNCHWENRGAFTGEVSPSMLLEAGCTYVIIGHSERRQLFGETNQSVNRRVLGALAAGLIPILCIGENLEERKAKHTLAVVERQLRKSLEDVEADDAETLVVAYEPVWAIGTGISASAEQAQEVHFFIRQFFEKQYNKTLANSIKILYGGSVKEDNVDELMAQPDIDGTLVGGASLKAAEFERIVRFMEPNAS
ncbi:MAG: triose-phosphate isomerase [Deltaproteobacteria bacterium]|nr:triose-phosphate isomerase [Deltaproteobacteria bacterium]MBW2305297.1 triose-phosphate isomerase [Deltaproteobacteria bacterium]